MKPIAILPIVLLLFSLPFLTQAVQLKNPLQYETIPDLINAVIDWLFVVALVIVPMVIVVAGYFFIASGGDPQKVTQAKNMVIYALIGLLIIILSRGIIALIKTIVGVQ